MIEFFQYAIEANFYLVLFTVFYFLLFRREKNYLANRLILVGSMILAWTIPSLSITNDFTNLIPAIDLTPIQIGSTQTAAEDAFAGASFSTILSWLYLSGIIIVLFFIIRNIISLLNLFAISATDSFSGFTRVSPNSNEAWSFFNFLVLGCDIPEENLDYIIEHERVHATEKHSMDKLLLSVVKILGWFNPAVYYLELALEENHEFRADQVVCERFENTTTYSHVLVSQSLGGISHGLLSHQFSKKSILKSRIKMIHQTKQTAKIKYLLTIPVIAVALFLHSCAKDESPSSSGPADGQKSQIEQMDDSDVFAVVEKMPEFNGGTEGLFAFMNENTVYPKTDGERTESGKVVVSFIVDEGGNVTNPMVVEDASVESPALRKAALETVAKMPQWTPGEQRGKKVKVRLNLPIKFELE